MIGGYSSLAEGSIYMRKLVPVPVHARMTTLFGIAFATRLSKFENILVCRNLRMRNSFRMIFSGGIIHANGEFRATRGNRGELAPGQKSPGIILAPPE